MEGILDTRKNFIGSMGFNYIFGDKSFNEAGQWMGWQYLVMYLIVGALFYLAVVKKFEPLLLLPIAFGMLLANLPGTGMFHKEFFINTDPNFHMDITQIVAEGGLMDFLYLGVKLGIYPSLIFMAVGAMTDFEPLIANPKSFLLGAAAQFGIFFTLCLASMFFPINDAASIAIIGAADGPTSIVVANKLESQYLGAIMVAAYSYMALVPIIQPPFIKLCTTKKERLIRMPYTQTEVKKITRILFPIIITIVAGLVAPASVSLVGFLMFGNLIRECGVLNSLSETAQKVLANLITIFLGITIACQMHYDKFLRPSTLLILGLGLFAFIFDTAGGVLFAKLLNLFLPKGKKMNPMIGAAGISAFPMSSRVVHKLGLEADNQNFLLMHATGVNVSGQVASVIAGGMILSFFK